MKNNALKYTAIVAFVLVLVGAINWLLVGLFQFDLVAAIFGGSASVFSRIIYTLVGISALVLIYVAIMYKQMMLGTKTVSKSKIAE